MKETTDNLSLMGQVLLVNESSLQELSHEDLHAAQKALIVLGSDKSGLYNRVLKNRYGIDGRIINKIDFVGIAITIMATVNHHKDTGKDDEFVIDDIVDILKRRINL